MWDRQMASVFVWVMCLSECLVICFPMTDVWLVLEIYKLKASSLNINQQLNECSLVWKMFYTYVWTCSSLSRFTPGNLFKCNFSSFSFFMTHNETKGLFMSDTFNEKSTLCWNHQSLCWVCCWRHDFDSNTFYWLMNPIGW